MTANQGSVQISASESVLPAIAHFEAQPGPPRGYMAVQKDDDKDAKPYSLYGRVRGKNWNSRLLDSKSRHTEKLDKQLEELWKTGNTLKQYWDGSKDIEISIGRLQMAFDGGKKITQADFYDKITKKIRESHPEAQNIAFDFSDFSVRYTKNGEPCEIKKEELPKEVLDTLNFLNLWQETHETAMLILGVRSWHSRLGTDTNRPVHGEKPFTLDSQTTLDLFMPKTHADFTKDHLETLVSHLSKSNPELRTNAEARIRKTHTFIERFKTVLQEEIQQKKSQQEPPKNEIAELEKLKEKLESIEGTSLYCLYWAAAFLGDQDPSTLSADDKSKKAQLLQNALLETFKDSRKLNSEKWKNPFEKGQTLSNWITLGAKPAEGDLKSLAIQAGDLYFHSDLDYLARFESSGAKRMVRPSIVEFVMNQIMHPESGYTDDLRSLELHRADPQLQQTIHNLIHQARQ